MKTQAFVPVFVARVTRLRTSLEEELKKPKKERRKSSLKSWIKEIRWLEKVVNQAKRDNNCPHCGGPL